MISVPRYFTVPFKLAANLSCLALVLAVGAGPSGILLIWFRLGPWIWIVAPASLLVAVALAVIFLPGLSLCGYLRKRLIRNQPPGERYDLLPFVGFAYSEFIGKPRLNSDDDVGFVRIGRDAVELIGESGTRRIAFGDIRAVHRARASWYSTLGAERRVVIYYDDHGVFRSVAISSREGTTIFETNRRTGELEAQVQKALAGSQSVQQHDEPGGRSSC
jgi:hypothetical protein